MATPDFRLFGKSEEFLITGDDLTYVAPVSHREW